MIQSPLLEPVPNGSAVPPWMILVEAVERLSDTRTFYDIIEIVKETARAISGADGVTFVLRDGDLSYYFEEDAISPLWRGQRFPMSACISGWCMEHGTSAVIPDIYADARIPHDAYRPTFVKGLIMTPVGRLQPFAAIGAYWAEQRSFGEEEAALLTALARSTAAAIGMVQARAAMRETDDRLRILFEAGKFGAWEMICRTGQFVASAAFLQSLGRAPEESFDYPAFLRAVHPDESEQFRREIDHALAEGGDLRTERRVVWPNGNVHWLEVNARVRMDANGKSERIAGVARDITMLRRATERLERGAA